MTEDVLLDELGDTTDSEQHEAVDLIPPPKSKPNELAGRGDLEKRSCAAKSYYDHLKHVFGSQFLGLLFLVQFCIKGIVYQVVRRGLFPLLKELNVEATLVQLYLNVAMSPWALKPVLGIASDVLVVRGKSKKHWMLASSVVGMLGAVGLAFGRALSLVGLIVGGMFALSMLGALSDLLSQAKYSELLREAPQSGSSVVVFANGSQQLGYAVACSLLIMFGFKVYLPVFVVVLLCAGSIFIPTLLNFLPEETHSFSPENGHRGSRHCFLLLGKISHDWKVFAVISLLGLLSQITAFLPLVFSGLNGLIAATLIFYSMTCLVLVLAWMIFESKWITIVAVYEVSKRIMRPRLDSALDFFYTASNDCIEGGPQLSQFIYITVACWMSVVASLVGLVMYQSLFKRLSFRKIVLLTLVLNAAASFLEFCIIQRWNVGFVPDSVAFLFVNGFIQPLTQMLSWLPGSVLMAKICPKGMESSVVAFLAGISNFAFGGAQLTGALWMKIFNIQSSLGNCDFAALPWLILGCHSFFPLLIGVPMSFLMPKERQDEDILEVFVGR